MCSEQQVRSFALSRALSLTNTLNKKKNVHSTQKSVREPRKNPSALVSLPHLVCSLRVANVFLRALVSLPHLVCSLHPVCSLHTAKPPAELTFEFFFLLPGGYCHDRMFWRWGRRVRGRAVWGPPCEAAQVWPRGDQGPDGTSWRGTKTKKWKVLYDVTFFFSKKKLKSPLLSCPLYSKYLTLQGTCLTTCHMYPPPLRVLTLQNLRQANSSLCAIYFHIYFLFSITFIKKKIQENSSLRAISKYLMQERSELVIKVVLRSVLLSCCYRVAVVLLLCC